MNMPIVPESELRDMDVVTKQGYLMDLHKRAEQATEAQRAVERALAEAKKQGALEEAAKHADCCVDREDLATLRATLTREREEHTAQLAALKVTWEVLTAERDGLRAEILDWMEATQTPTPEDAKKAMDGLRARVEQLIVQAAGVSTAAMGWISDTAKEGEYGWSVPYQDTLILRQKYDGLRASLKAEEAEADGLRAALEAADALVTRVIGYANQSHEYLKIDADDQVTAIWHMLQDGRATYEAALGRPASGEQK